MALALFTFTMVLWGGISVLFGQWLYEPYAATLNWPSKGGFFSVAVFPAMIASFVSRRKPGRKVALGAFLAASTVGVAMIANTVAAVAILWALDPSFVTGPGGYVIAVIAGLPATLPVAYGAMVTAHHWQAADVGREGEARA